ncbi:MAG: tetratricopeptide repeat protein [bacterium]|nr:tetratricopeptide repeat protein [bacterium]
MLAPGCVRRPSPLALLKEADQAFQAGDPARAAYLYYRLKRSREFRQHPGIRVSLGSAYLRLGWLPYAAGEFSSALKLSANTNALAWLGLGTCYARTNDWTSAILCFAHARSLDPYNPLVYLKLGNAFFQAREYAQAADNFLYAASLGKESDELYGIIGLCYERTAQWPRAAAAYEKAHKLNPKNDRVVRRAAALYRDRLGNMAKTRYYYDTLKRLNPEAARAEARFFEEKLRTAIITNPFWTALSTTTTAPALVAASNPPPASAQRVTQADYYESKARVSLLNDLPKEALKYYRLALEADPHRARYHRDIAEIYEKYFQDLNLAIKHLDRFLELCKDDSQFEQVLAHRNALREQYERQDAERLRRQREEEERRRAELERQRAEAEQRQKAFEATPVPESYDAALAAGARFMRDESLNLAEARRLFETAVSLNPSYPDAFYNLGLVAVRQTNFPESIQYFKTALAKDPRYAKAHLALGMVYERLLDRTNAIEHYAQYLDLMPNDTYSQTVRDRIEKLGAAQ